MRAQFDANRSVPTSGPVFEELVKGMDEATHMLKHEIVRGDLNEDTGRYGRFHRCFHYCKGILYIVENSKANPKLDVRQYVAIWFSKANRGKIFKHATTEK